MVIAQSIQLLVSNKDILHNVMCNTKQLHDSIRYINQLRLQFYVVLTKLSTYLLTVAIITSWMYSSNLVYNCVHTNYIVADVVSDAYTLNTSNKHCLLYTSPSPRDS